MANRLAAACIVATIAFWAYTATLLPGVDLGDTGGFQAAVLWPAVSARQSYPLYYGLARPFVSMLSPANPARGMNLFSAVFGAAAAGLLAYAASLITSSILAGLAAAAILAFSYTFWTQAIIAEVYTLNLTLVAICLIALHAYAARPTTGRLAVFFAVYALSFGNHFSMILWFGPFTLFLLLASPRPRELFRPRIVLLALAIAALGALQYWPNLWNLITFPDAPAGWGDRLAAFWFDVTKADWREEMVGGVGVNQLLDRLGMWWFDVHQQFGVTGVGLALAGAVALWRRTRRWALTLFTAFVITTAFTLTYNVGDTHVFFLPSHFLTAIFAGASLLWFERTPALRAAFVLFVSLVVGYGAWDTWPAVDRHEDRRGEQVIARLTLGVSDPDSMLVSSMNWQLENVLLYMGRYERPDLTWTHLGDVLPHFPFLVADQQAIGRATVMTSDAAQQVAAAYGPNVNIQRDERLPAPTLAEQAARIPRGVPYVLTLLKPTPDETLDAADLQAALDTLTRRHAPAPSGENFELIAGLSGDAPSVVESSDHPFRTSFRILDEPFTVRLESWLPFDTFRRAGFGHVLRGHRRVQILERGVNLVWLNRDGDAAPPVYAAGLYESQPRYVIAASAPPLPAYTLLRAQP